MKKERNLLANKLTNIEIEAIKKVGELAGDSSYDQTLLEIEENCKRTDDENLNLKRAFWREVRNNSSINTTKEKVMEGWSPNDLECEKLGILRI